MYREKTTFAVLAAAAAMVMTAGTGFAQVAPPPPPAEPEGEYIPPPPPAPRPARPVRPTTDSGERPDSSGVTTRRRDRTKMRQMTLPPIPYEPLGSPDLEGNNPLYRTALDLPALKHNPTVPQGKTQAVLDIARKRQARVELRLIENLDLLREIEEGKAATLLDKGMAGLMELNSLLAPLTEEDSLTTELFKAGVLSDMQARFNQKIITEFNAARRQHVAGIQDQQEQLRAFMQLLLEDALLEVLMAHRGLALESLLDMPGVLDRSGLGDTPQGKTLAAMAVDELPDDEILRDDLASKVLELLGSLETPQHAAFLRAVRQGRDDVENPPLVVVDLDIHYKKDMSHLNEDKPGIKVRTPADKGKPAEGKGDAGTTSDAAGESGDGE